MTLEDYLHLGLVRSGVSILFIIEDSWDLIRRGSCSESQTVMWMDRNYLLPSVITNSSLSIWKCSDTDGCQMMAAEDFCLHTIRLVAWIPTVWRGGYCFIAVLLYCCIAVLLYCRIAVLYFSIAMLLYCPIFVLLYFSVAVLPYCCVVVLLYFCIADGGDMFQLKCNVRRREMRIEQVTKCM